ncbi:DNA translocase FtsK [Enterococcus sp. LJL90]
MAKKRKTKKQQKQQEQLMLILIGIGFIFLAGFSLFQLGFLGRLVANGLRLIGGNAYPILSVLLVIYGGFLILQNKTFKIKKPRRLAGLSIFLLGILLFLHIRLFSGMQTEGNVITITWDLLLQDIRHNQISANVGGGILGAVLYSGSHFLVADFGSYIICLLFWLIGIYLFSGMDLQRILDFLQKVNEWLQGDPKKEQKTTRQQRAPEKKVAKTKAAPAEPSFVEGATDDDDLSWAQKRKLKKAERVAAQREAAEAEVARRKQNQVRPLSPGEELAQEMYREEESEPVPVQLEIPIDSFQNNSVSTSAQKHYEEPEEADNEDLEFAIQAEPEDRDYQLPPSTLLDSIPTADQSGEYKKIEENIGVLENTFKSFGVEARVVKASLGPSVTKFEIQPAVGVKVSKIVNLTDDIALALAAKDVRMEAPIPGKSLIGIEVPNSTVSTVSFRDIIEAQPDHPDKILEVPLGRDISGLVQVADLTKMPHLLIAGSTGSGKSVAINGIITSILMRAKPHEVKLMMIDPKMVELNVYNGIPHLLTPVVTNPRKAAQALQKVVKEMEERYEKFAATGVRNISGYNELITQKNLEDGQNHPILPFIVVIVDELADLMMVASNEVEDAIIRLAQMARAAGIHMILATQRPSVDVITGIIKANVPSRIAFAVSSGTDSRTIIDSNGAEKLLGRGDMLFLPMGENKPIRVQGAFISDHEVERVVKFVTDQQEADYQESMMVTEEEEPTSNPSEHPLDDLYEPAKELVVDMQTASISFLQRRFRIGYNRAARIVDELEENGVIGPSVGSKPREVYLQKEPETDEPEVFE